MQTERQRHSGKKESQNRQPVILFDSFLRLISWKVGRNYLGQGDEMNPNETNVNEDKDEQQKVVPDLEVSSDQAKEVQAGTFTPYSPTFRGGVFVASGDVN